MARGKRLEVGSPNMKGPYIRVIPGMYLPSGEGPRGTCCADCAYAERFNRSPRGRCAKYRKYMFWVLNPPDFDLRNASCRAFAAPPPEPGRIITANFMRRSEPDASLPWDRGASPVEEDDDG